MSKAIENTQVYCYMRDFDENTMKFVESDWHHAYLTYFNLIPSQENSFTDLEMTQPDIIAIINKYGSHPPKGNKYYRPIPDTAIQQSLLEFERKSPDKNIPDVDEKVTGELLNVMREGAKNFKEHTGREMSYLEIRSLYG
jgi:hypothetical protein